MSYRQLAFFSVVIIILTFTGALGYFLLHDNLQPAAPVATKPTPFLPAFTPTLAPSDRYNYYYNLISRIIDLPAGEKPTIFPVYDVEKLRDQPFFARAQNGDVVMIFSAAQKAYLYRPSANKLIEVSPITFNNNQIFNASQSGSY